VNREQIIKELKEEIPKDIQKCKKTKISFIQLYRLGKLYRKQELLRRLSGIRVDISRAYFTS